MEESSAWKKHYDFIWPLIRFYFGKQMLLFHKGLSRKSNFWTWKKISSNNNESDWIKKSWSVGIHSEEIVKGIMFWAWNWWNDMADLKIALLKDRSTITVTESADFGFIPILWRPQGSKGCLEKQNYPLSWNLVVWCAKIGPKS